MEKADAIFFAGGDQSKYYSEWADGTPLEKALRAAVARGVPIGGTSAGCDVQARYAYTGANGSVSSRAALRDPFDEEITLRNGSFVTHEPAGLLSTVLPDTQCVTRDRAGRMLAFLARFNGTVNGIGIDERTAIAIDKNGNGTVLAQGSRGGHAFIFKPRGAAETCKPDTPLDFEKVGVQRLTTGDSYNFVTMSGGRSSQRYEVSVKDGAFVKSPYEPPTAAVSTCTTSSDCSLAGECLFRRCAMLAGWAIIARSSTSPHQRQPSSRMTARGAGRYPARDPPLAFTTLYSYMVKECGLLLVRRQHGARAARPPQMLVADVGCCSSSFRMGPGNVHAPTIRFDPSTTNGSLL